jgi:hypothetical protein
MVRHYLTRSGTNELAVAGTADDGKLGDAVTARRRVTPELLSARHPS